MYVRNAKSAYVIGSGLAALTAAFYLVRDGQMKGERIHILEKLDLAGGSCDGRKDITKGYYMRGGREMDNHFEVMWDVYRDVPSIETPGVTVLDEYYWLNKEDPNYSLCRASTNCGRFGEPYAVRVYISDRRAGLQPEFHRNEGRHIAAEAVHQFSPHYKRIRQILPKSAVGVVQVDDVGPVAELVARLAVGVVVEVFRMLAVENRVGRGVVVDHIDHAFHAVRVDLAHQRFKVLHRAVGRVDGAVIAVGIGAAQRAFLALDADGVNGHQPDDIRPQRADAVEVGNDGAESALRRVVADVNGIDHLILQAWVGVCSHAVLPPQCFMPRL